MDHVDDTSVGRLFIFEPAGSPHVGTRQYARIVNGWVNKTALIARVPNAFDPAYEPTLIHRRTRGLRAAQLLLDHTKLESTVRYLGIEADDALEIAEQREV